jgi:NAD(P)-dependent dehydrogenase (short-subunit alcohol dehydrogenase family)
MMGDKKVALITGANKGVGFETARQLGQLGFTVIVGARDGQKGEMAASKLRDEGLDASSIVLDVTDDDSIAAAARWTENKFGKLDVLVNNAGIMPNEKAKASELPLATWRETFDTNVFGVVAVTQALLPLLRKSEAARIVNLSSILGSLNFTSAPGAGASSAAYRASKSALNAVTVAFAQELRKTPIKVNAAHPGWVKTDMGGEGAMLDLVTGAKTSVRLATLPDDGPTGGYFHLEDALAW